MKKKYLTDKTGGNIHDNGTIEVTTNSIRESYEHPKCLLDFKESNYYAAKFGESNFWVCFDFKDMKIKLTNYSIKSFASSIDGHLKNWVIEISNDGNVFKTIDSHSNNSELKGRLITKTFTIQSCVFARYYRLRHINEFWGCDSKHSSGFAKIEFYGELQENGR